MKNAKAITEVKKVELVESEVLQNLLNSIDIEKLEKKAKKATKNFLYKFDLRSDISERDIKKNRRKLRKERNDLVISTYQEYLKHKTFVNCEKFISFYKNNYVLNDFTLESLTRSSDEDNLQLLTAVLEICKTYLSKAN